MNDYIALAVLLFLLLGNAYFVAAEFAMVAARRDHVEPKAAEGSGPARLALRAVDELSNSLATTQLGITACSLLIGAVGEPALAHLLERPLSAWGVPEAMLHPIALTIALLIVTFLHMVFGEMVPKNIALIRPGPAALALGPSLRVITVIFRPFIWLMNHSANAFVKHVLRAEPTDDAGSTFTAEQLRSAVKASSEVGELDEDEHQLISGAIDFHGRTVATALTANEDIVAVPADATIGDIHALCAASGFSRLPVRGHDAQFVGYVHVKDVLGVTDLAAPLPQTAIRRIGGVDSDEGLAEVLDRMRRDQTYQAVVRDSATGETLGIVSLADVLENLVGAAD